MLTTCHLFVKSQLLLELQVKLLGMDEKIYTPTPLLLKKT